MFSKVTTRSSRNDRRETEGEGLEISPAVNKCLQIEGAKAGVELHTPEVVKNGVAGDLVVGRGGCHDALQDQEPAERHAEDAGCGDDVMEVVVNMAELIHPKVVDREESGHGNGEALEAIASVHRRVPSGGERSSVDLSWNDHHQHRLKGHKRAENEPCFLSGHGPHNLKGLHEALCQKLKKQSITRRGREERVK